MLKHDSPWHHRSPAAAPRRLGLAPGLTPGLTWWGRVAQIGLPLRRRGRFYELPEQYLNNIQNNKENFR